MKQSKSMRLMSILMILVMMSSIYASTTIARFSDVAQSSDTTRVAIWDINASEVIMDLFNTVYTDEETGNTLAKSHNTDNIIAPGTHGESLFSIVNHKGDIAPEVMYYIQIDLDDSQVSNDIITNSNIQWKLDDGSWGTWDQLKVALYSLSGSPSGIKTYQAGVLADAFKKNVTHSISWQWLEDDIDINTMTDDEDYTALINVKVTARQTDTVYVDAVEGSNLVVNVIDEIKPVVVKSSAPMNELVEVQVNGEVIERNVDYTVTEGSTIITLTETYLKTLPVGGYTISVISQKQTVNAKLDIVDREKCDSEILGSIHNGVIPEGGTYYRVSNGTIGGNYTYVGDTSIFGEVYNAGDEFPDTIEIGDTYVYGDYWYRYGYYTNISDETYISDRDNYWSVYGVKTGDYSNSEIITNINGLDVTNMGFYTFLFKEVTKPPVIPKSITNIDSLFNYATVNYMFETVTEISGSIEINATNLQSYQNALSGTQITEVTGTISDELKAAILATK